MRKSLNALFDGPEDYHARIDDPSLNITLKTLLFMRGTGAILEGSEKFQRIAQTMGLPRDNH